MIAVPSPEYATDEQLDAVLMQSRYDIVAVQQISCNNGQFSPSTLKRLFVAVPHSLFILTIRPAMQQQSTT